MRCSQSILSLLPGLLGVGSFVAAMPPPRPQKQSLHTWWHDKAVVSEHAAVAADEVRQSRKYNVSVSIAAEDGFQNSFVYETIPRNGNGKMYDPADLGRQYSDNDGISVEVDAGINMAWTQFQYAVDVQVRVSSTDGSLLGPESNVVIRPSNVEYTVTSSDDKSIVIDVPYDPRGRRFSVEFQNDLFEYRSDGKSYISSGGVLVSEEPRNALLIFASPFIPPHMIPSKVSDNTQVLTPGSITDDMIGSQPTLYFEAGTYWTENGGQTGKSHIKLDPKTHYVYFEPGTYLKGAIEYTTSQNFHTIGHGVVSGENYAYMANTAKGYVAEKDDRTSLRMFSHQSVADGQTWHCQGPTLNAPPFNTVDLFPKNHTPHEEDNKARNDISDYKQVGAFYFQTDGPQIYAGTTRDCFWHVNDDAIKLYHSDATVQDIVIWKCHNDPVIQMGWKPRGVSRTSVKGLDIIHSRWYKSETGVPSSIIGASPFYGDPKVVDSCRVMNVNVSDMTCEGRCPALFRIAPLQNYNMAVSNVKFDALLDDDNVKLGQSLIGMKISDQEDAYTPGQEKLKMGLHIAKWTVAGTKIDSSNWEADQLGQLNIHPDYAEDWTLA